MLMLTRLLLGLTLMLLTRRPSRGARWRLGPPPLLLLLTLLLLLLLLCEGHGGRLETGGRLLLHLGDLVEVLLLLLQQVDGVT